MRRFASKRLLGVGLLALLALGTIAIFAGWHVERAYRHVRVDIFNTSDVSRISVNCQPAMPETDHPTAMSVDLGWLDPDDRVSISVYNKTGDASWGFRIWVDGRADPIYGSRRGHADAAGFAADEFAFVMAKTFTADGDPLGTVGCAQPLQVSGALPGYRLLPDDTAVETVDGFRQRWEPPTAPFALIECVADWALPLLAIAGFVAAAATAEVRARIRRHWKISLGIGIIGLLINLWRGFGLAGLLAIAEGFGIVLLLMAAAMALCPHTASRCQSSSSTSAQKPPA